MLSIFSRLSPFCLYPFSLGQLIPTHMQITPAFTFLALLLLGTKACNFKCLLCIV